jgi:hypothetical protein
VKKRSTIRDILGGGLFLLISLLIVNNSLFVHVHTLSNGEVITHAHPFFPNAESKNSTGQHSHNKNEIQIYNILNSAIFLVIIVFLLDTVINFIISKKISFFNFILPTTNIFDLFNRPPPFVLSYK